MFCFLAMGVSGFLRLSPFGRDTMGQPLSMGDSPCFGDKPYLCEDMGTTLAILRLGSSVGSPALTCGGSHRTGAV